MVSVYEGAGEGEEDGGRNAKENEEVVRWQRGILKKRQLS